MDTETAPPHIELTPRAFRMRLAVFLGLAVLAAAWLWSRPAMPQHSDYHHFADQRTLFGVPHFWNVVSNIPFLVVGALGLCFLFQPDIVRPDGPFLESAERWPYALCFVGVGLTSFGSTYYHLDPTNDRLLWDRLPMALGFTSLFAAQIAERINVRLGIRLLWPMAAFGVATVLYWHWTEQQGRGDLRPYYFVQFYPAIGLPLLLLLFPPRYTRTLDLIVVMGLYVAAKLFEHPGDAPLFALGGWMSGHTLKHLTAALAVYWVLRMLQKRRRVGQ